MNAKRSVIAAQSAVRGKKARYSHAALTLSHRNYLDSLTQEGVALRPWQEVEPDMPLTAYRFDEGDDAALQRIRGMLEHYGKKYNYAFALKNLPILKTHFSDALFCSELIDQIYSRSELGLPKGGIIMPTDLESLAENPHWTDVSAAYAPLLGKEPAVNNPDADDNFVKTALAGQAVDRYLEASNSVMAQADELANILKKLRP
jgi:hypothetical protein